MNKIGRTRTQVVWFLFSIFDIKLTAIKSNQIFKPHFFFLSSYCIWKNFFLGVAWCRPSSFSFVWLLPSYLFLFPLFYCFCFTLPHLFRFWCFPIFFFASYSLSFLKLLFSDLSLVLSDSNTLCFFSGRL